MAKTLTKIETLVRFNARDDIISLTVEPGLSITNSIYREVAAAFPWSELRKTVDLSAPTVDGQSIYSWANGSSAVFTDVKGVEIETAGSGDIFNLLNVPSTEWEWNEAAKTVDTIPVYYIRINDNGTDSVEIRPAPDYSAGVIRVIGIVEPAEFTLGSSVSEFLTSTADDALAYLIAANYAVRKGSGDLMQINIQKATAALKMLFGKEQVTQETVQMIAGI